MRAILVGFYLFFLCQPGLSFTVILDPGHGGSDRGTVHHGQEESKIVLDLTKKIYDKLKYDRDITAHMTRVKDKFLSLEARADFAHAKKGDLFLSIHANSSPDPKARGKEIYFQNQLPPDEETLFLANLEHHSKSVGARKVDRKQVELPNVKAIIRDLERNQFLALSGHLSELLHLSWTGPSFRRKLPIRQAPFFVISNVNMPSALVEVGYLSNQGEAKRFAKDRFQDRIAGGIADAIRKFKEVIDKKASTTLN